LLQVLAVLDVRLDVIARVVGGIRGFGGGVELLVRLDLVAGLLVVREPTGFLLALVRH
jgi:hypothetical protein